MGRGDPDPQLHPSYGLLPSSRSGVTVTSGYLGIIDLDDGSNAPALAGAGPVLIFTRTGRLGIT
jgi:hypothetical protein